MKLLALLVACLAAAAARADITPLRCWLNCMTYIDGNGPQGPFTVDHEQDQPFPPNPLGSWLQMTESDRTGFPTYSEGYSSSTIFAGPTLIRCSMRAASGAAAYPAGMYSTATANTFVQFEFSVTDPVQVVLQATVSASSLNGLFVQEAHAYVLHDGEDVAGFSTMNGGADQWLTLTLGPGTWDFAGSCYTSFPLDHNDGSDLDQRSLATLSLDVQVVPAPGALALHALALVAGMRRR